jgi:hypothetical protein
MRAAGAVLTIQLSLVSSGFWAGSASAEPVSGPHQVVDQRFTTTQPGAPSGFDFDATYHAAGDPEGDPPYMRRMISYNPAGLRYDTSVPERCSASDLELAVRGPAACPEGSRLGGGETDTKFMGSSPSTVQLDFFNNTDEQIILARSPLVTTVARGRIHPDGSVEFASPTCYPTVGPAPCPVDNVLQLRSSMRVPAYTDSSGGSWLTTPPECSPDGRWRTPIRWWWADGSEETVVTEQPCTP